MQRYQISLSRREFQATAFGVSERDLLDSCPLLRADDLANAWAHARVHAAKIDHQIQVDQVA